MRRDYKRMKDAMKHNHWMTEVMNKGKERKGWEGKGKERNEERNEEQNEQRNEDRKGKERSEGMEK